jgi:hypothetical protein
MKKYLFFSIVIVIALITPLHAQPATLDSLVTKIELKDGSTLIGTLITEDSLGVDFRTLGGVTARIAHTQIRFKFPYKTSAIISKDSAQRGTIIDPNRTRLFLMPTARPIGSGNGYFSAYEVFFPTLAFGIGNIVSVAGGMSIFPGSSNQLFYFAPKVTVVNTTNTSLAVGGLYLGAGGTDEGTSLLYGAATFGNEKSSLTIAASIPTEREQNSLIVIGGELQTSSSLKLITENWIFSNSVLYSFGIRFFGEKLAADLGFMRTGDMNNSDGFPFFPWLGFAYNFGTPATTSSEAKTPQHYSSSTYRARASFGLFTTTGNNELKKYLDKQGFKTNEYSGGLFSSGNENNRDGNGLLLQVERSFNDNLSFGITVSTIGKLVGGNSSLSVYKYFQTPNYYSTYITVEHSIFTYGVHVSYSSSQSEDNDRVYSFGAGIGNSDIATDWKLSDYYYYNLQSTGRAFSNSQLTGFVFLTLDQHITQLISIGVDGSYFFMANTKIGAFDLGSITYKDYSTNPPTDRIQTISVGSMIPNFGYGKAGISLGIHF